MSKIPDIQAAVRSIVGVRHASIRWPEPYGPATLRIEFAEGADEEAVTAEVLQVLRDVGEVDLSSLEVGDHESAAPAPKVEGPRGQAVPPAVQRAQRDEAPAGGCDPGAVGAPVQGQSNQAQQSQQAQQPEQAQGKLEPSAPPPPIPVNGRGLTRPVFTGIMVERTDLDSAVTVTLRLEEQTATGTASGLATRRSSPRTAAAATLNALRSFLTREVRVQLDWLEIVKAATPERPDIVQAAVTCLTPTGEETFVGSAVVRGDLREAAVRATLDALNRRLARLAATTA